MEMVDIAQLRNEIDRLNDEIVDLLCKRMDCSIAVAKYKVENGLAVLDSSREDEILNHVRSLSSQHNEKYEDIISHVFSVILSGSRSLQYPYIDKNNKYRQLFQNLDKKNTLKSDPIVACQGVAGAYSHEAASAFFPTSSPLFVETFTDVFTCITDGSADYGVVPVENSNAGSVNEVYDLIMHSNFYIVEALTLPINHCLVGIKNSCFSDIKSVYSHPQALLQCSDFITENSLISHNFSNTASAAEMISGCDDKTMAAIASKKAAEIYGLEILAENIQNSNDNCTRFVTFAKDIIVPKNANKISLMFALPHVTGSLYHTLSRFAMSGLNLTKIESRPLPDKNFTYLFYLDFEGSLAKDVTKDLICALSSELDAFTFLGHYYERTL